MNRITVNYFIMFFFTKKLYFARTANSWLILHKNYVSEFRILTKLKNQRTDSHGAAQQVRGNGEALRWSWNVARPSWSVARLAERRVELEERGDEHCGEGRAGKEERRGEDQRFERNFGPEVFCYQSAVPTYLALENCT